MIREDEMIGGIERPLVTTLAKEGAETPQRSEEARRPVARRVERALDTAADRARRIAG